MDDVFIDEIGIINNVIKSKIINKITFYDKFFEHEIISDKDFPYISYKYYLIRLSHVISMLNDSVIDFAHGITLKLSIMSDESYKKIISCLSGDDIDIKVKKRKMINKNIKKRIDNYLKKLIFLSKNTDDENENGNENDELVPSMKFFYNKYRESYTVDITFNLHKNSKIDKKSSFKYKKAFRIIILLRNKIKEINKKDNIENDKKLQKQYNYYQCIINNILYKEIKPKNRKYIYNLSMISTFKLLLFMNDTDFKYYCNKKIRSNDKKDLLLLRDLYMASDGIHIQIQSYFQRCNTFQDEKNQYIEYRNIKKNIETLKTIVDLYIK